jgi:hypothetical protein
MTTNRARPKIQARKDCPARTEIADPVHGNVELNELEEYLANVRRMESSKQAEFLKLLEEE